MCNIAQAEIIITNTATANFSINSSAKTLSDSVQFTKDTVVKPTDEINLTKQANVSSTFVGEIITYTLTIGNPNSSILNNVIIKDTLPPGIDFQEGSFKLNNQLPNSNNIQLSNSQLTITIGNIPANETFTATYQAIATSSGTLVNQAYAQSDTANSKKAQSTVIITLKPEQVFTPLVLTKKANLERVKPGDLVRYSLLITNKNDTPVNNAILNDTLPSGLNYIEDSATLNNKKITKNTSNGLVFTLGSIPAETSWLLEYDVIIANSNNSFLTNLAVVSTEEKKTNSNVAKSTIGVSSDKIILTKTTKKEKVKRGETLQYTVNVYNPQNHTLSNIILNDFLPTGFTYKKGSAAIDGITLSSVQVNSSKIIFFIESLIKKQNVSLTYELLVTDDAIPGEAKNTVKASSDYAISNIASNSVTVRTPSTIEFLIIDNNSEKNTSVIPSTSFNDNKAGGKHWEEITPITLRDGTVVDLTSPQPLRSTNQYTLSDPIVIKVTDLDQNKNPKTIDTIIVEVIVPESGDKEILLLKETSPNSGVFIGIIAVTAAQSQVQNGVLSLSQGSKITVSYQDEDDTSDLSATAALIIPESQIVLIKESDKQKATIGEQVRYTLTFTNTTGYVIPNLIIKDTLPIGFNLLPNTSTLNSLKTIHNIMTNGRHLTFNLGEMKIGERWSLEYKTKITSGVQFDKAINIAQIDSSRFKSNLAQATITIKDDLMRSKNILTGRIYVGCKKEGNDVEVLPEAKVYLETGRNVLSDKEGFWHMEGVNPGTHVLQIDTKSLSKRYQPIICEGNTRYAKNSQSQFVNLQAGTLWHVDFHVEKINTAENNTNNIKKKVEASNPSKLFNSEYLKNTSNSFEILWPKNNYVPPVASTKIYIKSSPNHKVEVYLNGKQVSALNYGGSDTNKTRTATIRRWLGVDIDIKRKNNTLLAILKDKSGKEIARKTHNIHFSSNPNSAKFIKNKSILIADGRTIPVITLRIKDEDGYPMRANTHGYFSLKDNRFSIKTQKSVDGTLNLNESISGTYKYQIEEGGIAHIELNPTTQSGEIKLELKFPKSNNKTITAWLKPQLREWVLIGLAEGSVAYKTISGNIEALKDLDKAEKVYKQGRIAFFAKGKIKGKYLLTLAYDSHKKKYDAGHQLNGDINPDSWYTIYADNSRSQYDAPSSRKLFIKLEKDTFYTVFGDYRTGMSVVELAKFERTLNGIKSEYKGKNISYKAFASETSNNHHHDEITGDGTSGLYYLSNFIIPNSEVIRIETRDRFHSEKMIETREMIRYQDYDIDYDAGTLFFKFPITGRDSNFNPNIIVIDYDSSGDKNKNIVLGGRLAVQTSNKKLEVGVSTINITHDNFKDDSLIAMDATLKLTENTKIHAEIAQSKTRESEYESINAQIIELEKTSNNVDAKVYYRKQADNFGIDSQVSEIGTKKAGIELTYKINKKTSIETQVSKQRNVSNDNKRQLAEIKLNHRFDQYELNTGIRHSKETISTDTQTNDTFLLGGKYTTNNGKLTLRGNLEKNINKNNNSEQSPDRALAGVDVRLKQGLTLFFEHEISDNDAINTQNSRIGINKNLWKGAKGRTTVTQERTDQGQRNYATLGLSQNIKLNDKISADISFDHARTIGAKNKAFNSDEPKYQGAQHDDYTAFSVGLGSNNKKWSWSTRTEVRKGKLTDKINVRAGLIRHLSDGRNLSAKLSYTDVKNSTSGFTTITKLSLGSAWHPKDKNFTFFSRLDLNNDKKSNDNEIIHTKKIIHNLHYSRRISKKTQFSIHHGIKHLVDNNNKLKTHATIDTATLELRKDLTERWDIGVHAGYLHDWTEENTKAVAGISVGVTPAKNSWLQFGYNVEGFDDSDFDKNNYKRKGIYINFSYKFDQDSFRRKTKKVSRIASNKNL